MGSFCDRQRLRCAAVAQYGGPAVICITLTTVPQP
jgi:hypothetical protein